MATSCSTVRVSGTPICALGHEPTKAGGLSLDGIFGTWRWDGHTLSARNDRYGMYPLYYFEASGRFVISPSITRLLDLGAPTRLDAAALAVFLRLGFFLGEDTPFQAIRALPPAAGLEWESGQVRVSGQKAATRPQSLSRNAAIDAYVDLFRLAMARRLPPDDNFALPLSGGRDSRHILFELYRAGRLPKFCATMRPFPPQPLEDVVVAGELAATIRVPHVVIAQSGSRVRSEIQKNRLTGFCTDEHTWLLPMAAELRRRQVARIFDGIGGDILSSGLFLTRERLDCFEAGRFEELAIGLFDHDESQLAHLLRPEWAARFNRNLAVSRVAEELANHVSAANPIGAFYFWNRTRREIALSPYRILGRGVEVLSPYLDRDLYDFLASLSASMFLDKSFHTETINRAFPEYAKVRFEDRGLKRRRASGYVRRVAAELAAFAVAARVQYRRAWLVNVAGLLRRAVWLAECGDVDLLASFPSQLAVYLLQLEATQ